MSQCGINAEPRVPGFKEAWSWTVGVCRLELDTGTENHIGTTPAFHRQFTRFVLLFNWYTGVSACHTIQAGWLRSLSVSLLDANMPPKIRLSLYALIDSFKRFHLDYFI